MNPEACAFTVRRLARHVAATFTKAIDENCGNSSDHEAHEKHVEDEADVVVLCPAQLACQVELHEEQEVKEKASVQEEHY